MQKITFHALAALCFGQLFLWAQNPTATLVGSVHDSSGAIVTDAKLEVRNADTGDIRKAVTDSKGDFTVPDLLPGPYEVTITKAGFRSLRETNIVLQLDQFARMEFKLEVGAVNQTVEVTAAAAPLINTENGSQGQVMTASQIVEMPLNGRDFSNLAYLVPGVTQSDITIEGSGFSVNGARPDNTNFVIDGVADRDPRVGFVVAKPNLDALQEFKMQTNNFSAEYGQLAGGVMNMVLKSGTNQFHGTLFEFIRNNDLDARNFFAQQSSELRQNQFGGVLTGPVTIPKIYNGHDRTFFLFSWQSLREVNGMSTLGAVPSALQRQGIFSTTPISDPLSTGTCPGSTGKGACFPGNQIPQSRLSPQALAAEQYLPEPNLAGANNMAAPYTVVPTSWDSWIMKFDEHLSEKNTLTFRYSKTYTRNYSAFPNASAANSNNTGLFGANQHNHTTLAGLTFTHMFSPGIINEARIGFTRNNENDISAFQGVDYNAKFGIPGLTTDPRLIGMPLIYVSGYQQIGPGVNFPVLYSINTFQYGDTLTWVKGAHLAKFGFDMLHSQFNQPYWNNARGNFTFTGFWTGQPWADYLLGYLNGDSRQVGTVNAYLLNTDYGAFAEDDWKVSSRLTLNFGMRYEIPKPPIEEYGRLSNFVPGLNKLVFASQSAIAPGVTFSNSSEIASAAQVGLPPSLVHTHYDAFAPRFGFAWRPFGGNRAVVRGGYGIFYGVQTLNPIKNQMSAAFPYVITQSENRGTTDPTTLTFANDFPVPPNLNGNLSSLTMVGWEVKAPIPYLQSWNIAIEKEIGFSSALKAAYVGSKGTHFGIQTNLNQPLNRSAALPGGQVLYPNFGTINYFSFEDNSIYNGATLTWERRFVRNFFYVANYTYSKCINDASNLNGAPIGGVNGLQNTYNLRGDRGCCDWDIPHQFTMSFSWMSPSHNMLLRGWQFAGTSRLYSGTPFTPTVTNANLNLGQASRPNRIGKGTVSNPGPSAWFDVADFPQVPQGAFTFGNSGRSILDAPGRIELNVSLYKNFFIRERSHVQFRWELFDVLNHPNFGIPENAVNAPNAATLLSASTNRLMQFGFRYEF